MWLNIGRAQKDSDTRCWLKKPLVVEKDYKYKKEIRTKKVLKNKDEKPIKVSGLVQNINDYLLSKVNPSYILPFCL